MTTKEIMEESTNSTNNNNKTVLVVGSGIAGMTTAISLAERGIKSILVSPFVSERAQSVMAAGGINAALDNMGEGTTFLEINKVSEVFDRRYQFHLPEE